MYVNAKCEGQHSLQGNCVQKMRSWSGMSLFGGVSTLCSFLSSMVASKAGMPGCTYLVGGQGSICLAGGAVVQKSEVALRSLQ